MEWDVARARSNNRDLNYYSSQITLTLRNPRERERVGKVEKYYN